MIETIEFKNISYPKFQAEGFASQFAIPYATKVCKGIGYDIGCNRIEWSLPGSIPVDVKFNNGYDAINLPYDITGKVNYIYSSHCLEHISGDWYRILQIWVEHLKENGVLFLYLPDYSQEYWRPWNNRKHVHIFTPQIMKDAFLSLNLKNVFVSGIDLNNSFMIMGEV